MNEFVRIAVNKNTILSNKKHSKNDPPIAIRTYSNQKVKTPKKTQYAHKIYLHGPSRIVYCPNDPLACGARVWVETYPEYLEWDYAEDRSGCG